MSATPELDFLERAIEAIGLLRKASAKLSFSALSFMLAAAEAQAENDLVVTRRAHPGSSATVVAFGRREMLGRRATETT
jgi:hypothetical protein